MTEIQEHWRGPAGANQKHLRRPAISGLIVTLILIGIGASMTFAAMGGVFDNIGSLTGTDRLVIETVSAYTNDNRLVISGNIKNLGSGIMESVTIDEITVGDLVIAQLANIEDGAIAAGHGTLTLSGLEGDGTDFSPTALDLDSAVAAPTATTNDLDWTAVAVAGTPATDTATEPNTDTYHFLVGTVGGATISITGLSIDENSLVTLTAGSSKSFRIVVTGISSGSNPDVLDILRTVPASSELYITVTGTDGSTSTISDPRSTRVTQR